MKAYIFDLDGTLLDSMGVWEQIDAEFLTKRGIEMPPDYISAVCALSFQETAAYTIERFGLPVSVDELLKEWNAMAVHAYGHTVALKPYAREFLTAVKERGVKLGIATSLPAALYEPSLRGHGIIEMFDVVCSTDEVGLGKSSPEVFLYTADKLGAAPKECVVFEDILQAIQSAKLAGMVVYGVFDEASKEQWAAIQKIADGVLYDFKDAPLPQ